MRDAVIDINVIPAVLKVFTPEVITFSEEVHNFFEEVTRFFDKRLPYIFK